MNDASLLPLFPLNTVLFPGQLLPLYIFEPRYRIMIDECLEGDSLFGVVLIREGQEVGGEAEPYKVGTLARIRRVERLEDGRMNILCLGEIRFRINRLENSRPFLQGFVEPWPWVSVTGALQAEPQGDLVSLHRQLARYLQSLAKATGNKIDLDELPSEPLLLANLAAIALQISNREKQELLSAPSLLELVENCTALLVRENRALRIAAAIPDRRDDHQISPN